MWSHSRLAVPFLLAALWLAAACAGPSPAPAGPPGTAGTTFVPATCGSIQRLHALGGVYLASQPSAADLECAKELGVKTVINLRHPREMKDFDERAVVEGLGLAYVSLPWNGAEELTDEVFARSRALLRDSQRPILLHCARAVRVGAVWVPYRVLDDGISLEAAVAEARTIGLASGELEQKAREYVAREQRGR